MKRFRPNFVVASLLGLALSTAGCGDKDEDPTGGGDGSGDGGADGTTGGDGDAGGDDGDGDAGGDDGGDGGGGDPGDDGDDGDGGDGDGSTGDDGGSTGDDTGGGGFIDDPDGGVVEMCDPGLQDCPEDNEKCTGRVQEEGACCVDSNHCVEITGEKRFGEECTRMNDTDDCAAGFFCMTSTSGASGEGICMEYCVPGDESSCESGGDCIAFNDGTLPLCQTKCDPLLQDCEGSQGCYPAFEDFVCARPAYDGDGQDGADCYTVQSCAPGFACLGADSLSDCSGQSCCSPFCDVTGDDPCQDPEVCTSLFAEGMAPLEHEDVGACLVPM